MADEEYEKAIKFCAPIAKPLASQKLCKKVLKLCKKATKSKQVKRGVKEVVKAIRKKNKGCVEFFKLSYAYLSPRFCFAPVPACGKSHGLQDCGACGGYLTDRRHHTRTGPM